MPSCSKVQDEYPSAIQGKAKVAARFSRREIRMLEPSINTTLIDNASRTTT